MKKFKVGIIGLGFIGMVHLEALRRLDNIEVIAVSETDLTKAKACNVKKVYEHWEELVADPEIEVVHNCTPNHFHFAINQACLKAGKHVLSEKPLAMDSRETFELTQLATANGLKAGVNFAYRYYPMVQWAKDLIRTGYLGKIKTVHGRYLQDWLMFDTDYNWRVEENLGGRARALGDIGSHWCDLACYLTGLEIQEVMADYVTILPVRQRPRLKVETFQQQKADTEPISVTTDDWAAVLLHFEQNVVGNFIVSQVSAGHKNDLEIEIDGSLRSLFWRQEDPEHLVIGERGGANHTLYKDPAVMPEAVQALTHFPSGHPEGFPDAVKNNFIQFYSALQEQPTAQEQATADYPTFNDGHRITKAIEGIIQSSVEKKWIQIFYER
ncbi:MAG TPA: dehydrogenase [Firmicutes bacterium]|nr:dehydrogenase [Bacillota bacterium]